MNYNYFFLIFFVFFSCNEKNEKTDFKLVELDYNFQNHVENLLDKDQPLKIKNRNILFIDVDSLGSCKINDKKISHSEIINTIKNILETNSENPKMPSTVKMNFTHAGEVLVKDKLILACSFNEKIKYHDYKKIRNKVFLAYSEVRNNFSRKKYGKDINTLMKPFLIKNEKPEDLNKATEIFQIYPIRYYETTKQE